MSFEIRHAAASLILGALALAGCSPASLASMEAEKESRVERGRYLVTIGGCNDCHTPWILGPNGPQPDPTRLLSGHPQDIDMLPAPEPVGPWTWSGAATNTAFSGPWGVSFAQNLTPDELSGIGIWTEDIFMRAIRTGRHWGTSRPILPPMPWFNYREMTDEDLRSVYAYLRTLPPVRNYVPHEVLAGQEISD